MPIVFVCDTKLSIVWVDGNFCEVIDCQRHPALGQSLHDFLGVPEGHGFRDQVARLTVDVKRASYSTRLASAIRADRLFDFYVEHVPSFDGIEGASVIAVGVELPEEVASVPGKVQVADDAADGTDDLRRAYRYSNLREEDGQALFARLERLIDTTEAYRQSSFTLEDAAAQLSSNVLYVSQVTNYFAGMSFPNYLNQKRYEKLKQLVANDGHLPLSVHYTSAGFGSYSGLNRFLKNQYGLSPTEFVREVKEGQAPG